jgi:hypothetical protein
MATFKTAGSGATTAAGADAGAAAGAGAASSFLPQATRADAAAATKSNFFMDFSFEAPLNAAARVDEYKTRILRVKHSNFGAAAYFRVGVCTVLDLACLLFRAMIRG